MAAFTAAIFATQQNPANKEHYLRNYALLFEGSKPCWKIHQNNTVLCVIPHPEFITEDGLWLLHHYQSAVIANDAGSSNAENAVTAEKLFGTDVCMQNRKNLSHILSKKAIVYKFILWPGFAVSNLQNKIKELQQNGVSIVATVQFEPQE